MLSMLITHAEPASLGLVLATQLYMQSCMILIAKPFACMHVMPSPIHYLMGAG